MLKLGQVVGLDIVTQSPFQPTPSVPSLHICIQRAENYSMKKIHPSAGKVYQNIALSVTYGLSVTAIAGHARAQSLCQRQYNVKCPLYLPNVCQLFIALVKLIYSFPQNPSTSLPFYLCSCCFFTLKCPSFYFHKFKLNNASGSCKLPFSL